MVNRSSFRPSPIISTYSDGSRSSPLCTSRNSEKISGRHSLLSQIQSIEEFFFSQIIISTNRFSSMNIPAI